MIGALYLLGRYPATMHLIASWEPGAHPAHWQAHWLITYRVWAGRNYGVKGVPHGSAPTARSAAEVRETACGAALRWLARGAQ